MHQNLITQLKHTLLQLHSLHQLHVQATSTPTQGTVALNRGCKDPPPPASGAAISLSKTFKGELVF